MLSPEQQERLCYKLQRQWQNVPPSPSLPDFLSQTDDDSWSVSALLGKICIYWIKQPIANQFNILSLNHSQYSFFIIIPAENTPPSDS